MRRNAIVALIAVLLGGYGIYTASFVPGLIIGTPVPLLLVCFLIQACAAILAAVGVWQGQSWTPGTVLLLGGAVAATQILEAFAVGVIAYDRALVVAISALMITVAMAIYLRKQVGAGVPIGATRFRPI